MIPGAFVVAALRGIRVGLSDEKSCQGEVHGILSDRLPSVEVVREYRLAPGDIVDFWIDRGIALEVKLRRTPKASVFRQLRRYAAHPEVRGIILASNTAMGLPEQIKGKDAWFVSLGSGWL